MTPAIVFDPRTRRRRPQAGELDAENLTFGRKFSPHMFVAEYRAGEGWQDPRIEPYGPFMLEPAALCLHYAQEVFEGLKAYAREDGEIGLFRPRANARRFNASCRRICIPEIDEELFVAAIEALVDLDRDWVPRVPGSSLYIRPTAIASEAALGLRVSRRYLFFVITGPVGPYFGSFEPIRITTMPEFTRAAPGGMGDAKTAGNYAASLLPARLAAERGYHQVLYLDAAEKRYVEELGGMNLFIRSGNTLSTPPLTGTILPGITRDSLISLAGDHGYEVEERPIAIDDLVAKIDAGQVDEIFACGTAAVATPIGVIGHQGLDHKVGDGRAGEATRTLFKALTDIQFGRGADPRGWTRVVCAAPSAPSLSPLPR